MSEIYTEFVWFGNLNSVLMIAVQSHDAIKKKKKRLKVIYK